MPWTASYLDHFSIPIMTDVCTFKVTMIVFVNVFEESLNFDGNSGTLPKVIF